MLQVQAVLSVPPASEAAEAELSAEFERLCAKKFKSSCPQLFKPWRMYRGRWTLKRVRTKSNKDMFAEMQSTGRVMAEVIWGKGGRGEG